MKESIEVIIPTSPIPEHPKTDTIDMVISSVRAQLPDSKIRVSCDGVRSSVKHREYEYALYKDNLYEKVLSQDIQSLSRFTNHIQQVGMARELLEKYITPLPKLILWCEHDCVLSSEYINWESIASTLLNRDANFVRLYWLDKFHPEHEYLSRGEVQMNGANYLKVVQFSGWPFVTRSDYLRDVLEKYDDGSPQMIESILYGPCANSPWEDFKIVVYYEPGRTKNFLHLDGRKGDPKSW